MGESYLGLGIKFIFFIIFLASGGVGAVLWVVLVFGVCFWGWFVFYPDKIRCAHAGGRRSIFLYIL